MREVVSRLDIIFSWILTKAGWLEAISTKTVLKRLRTSSIDGDVQE